MKTIGIHESVKEMLDSLRNELPSRPGREKITYSELIYFLIKNYKK